MKIFRKNHAINKININAVFLNGNYKGNGFFNDNRKKDNCLLPNPTLHLKPKADDKRTAECEKY